MAQLRQKYSEFVKRGTEVLVVGPDSQEAFHQYWQKENLPFIGLADPSHEVAGRYGQEVRLLRLGRLPALMVIDPVGMVRYTHYGSSMADIPPTSEVLAVLDRLQTEESADPDQEGR